MIGQTISHYEILDKLGEGGMGAVYRARDSSLDREVALKVLPPEVATDPDRLERFQREAKALAALDHPNIVTVFSVENADGVHLLTMQLVEGKRLSDLIPKGGMALERIFEIAGPLADALAAAHERGIVHRDLKPTNIMVTHEGRVMVLDFGLAKLRPEVTTDEATTLVTEPLTREGLILGTLPYMSPEQLEGKDLDTRSDIFSLGVILYEMATGGRPFRGESSASLISSIMTETPREVDAVRDDLPHHLGRIVRRCLEKEPKRRVQSAIDVHNEFQDLRQEVASGERPTPSAVPPPRPRVKWIALGGVALVLVGIVGVGLWKPWAPADEEVAAPAVSEEAAPERKMIVVLPFENLGPPEDAHFAAGMTEEITSRLASVRDLGVISRTSAVQYDPSGKTMKEVGSDLGVDYVLEGTVRWSRPTEGPSRVLVTPRLVEVAADTNLWSERYDETLADIFAVQAQIAKGVIRELEVALLEPERERLEARPTDSLEAYQAYLRGMENLSRPGTFADQESRVAVRMFERALNLDPGFALAHARLSWARSAVLWHAPPGTVDLEQARIGARQAAEKALELAPGLPEAHAAMGRYYYWAEGDYDRALEHLAVAAKGLPSDSEIGVMVGAIYRRQGDWENALDAFRQAAALDPRSSQVAVALATTLTALRRYEEADREYARGISLDPDQGFAYDFHAHSKIRGTGNLDASRAILEANPAPIPFWSECHWDAQLWLERDYAGLLQRAERADSIIGAGCGPGVYSRLYEGAAYELLGDAERAAMAYEKAMAELERQTRERPDDPGVRIALAEAHAGLGRKERALREGRRAIALVPVSQDALDGAVLEWLMAHIHLMVGEPEEALDLLGRLLSVPSLVSVQWLRLDPTWDALRDDPRFQALLEEYG